MASTGALLSAGVTSSLGLETGGTELISDKSIANAIFFLFSLLAQWSYTQINQKKRWFFESKKVSNNYREARNWSLERKIK